MEYEGAANQRMYRDGINMVRRHLSIDLAFRPENRGMGHQSFFVSSFRLFVLGVTRMPTSFASWRQRRDISHFLKSATFIIKKNLRMATNGKE
jgi:hypothetical protein